MREPEHIDQDEMRTLLREAYSQDAEKALLVQVTRNFRDPAMPRDAGNPWSAHPLWLTLAVIAVFVLGVFLYFNRLSP
jgi:hypothetical protein